MAEIGFPEETIPRGQIKGPGAEPKVGPGVQKTIGETPKREASHDPKCGTPN